MHKLFKRVDLERLELNLYANKLGAEGVDHLVESLQTQKSLKALNIDLYFNNLT
jgi:hypothetical protein